MREFISIIEATEAMLTEGFYDGFEGENGMVEVFKNPSKREFDAIYRAHGGDGGVRGFLDGTDLYIWDAYLATHEDVDSNINLWGQRFDWQQRLVIYWNWDYEDEAYPEGGFQDFDEVRQWLLTVPSLRRLLPGFEIVKG